MCGILKRGHCLGSSSESFSQLVYVHMGCAELDCHGCSKARRHIGGGEVGASAGAIGIGPFGFKEFILRVFVKYVLVCLYVRL